MRLFTKLFAFGGMQKNNNNNKIIIIIIITIVRERETKKSLSGMEKLFWPNAKRVADCTYVGYF